ncbi:hypothetical protein B0H17DRAFT_879361, partial [Mycena rosella]
KDKQISARELARLYEVDPCTLRRRAAEGISMTDFNEKKQKLTPKEERVLVDHILMSADRGFPLTHKSIISHVNGILKSRGG